MKHEPERFPTRNRLVSRATVSTAGVLAVMMAFMAIAWACTPLLDENEITREVHRIIHDGPTGASTTNLVLNLEVLGPIVSAAGTTASVYQNNDNKGPSYTYSVAGCSGISTMAGPEDPTVGSITYDAEGNGLGTATVSPVLGPGTYEICAYPWPEKIKGYVTFW